MGVGRMFPQIRVRLWLNNLKSAENTRLITAITRTTVNIIIPRMGFAIALPIYLLQLLGFILQPNLQPTLN